MTGYFISIGNIIIDDIILPDGSSRMGTLGGGATHAVMGMRIWTEQVGLVTPVGADFGGDQLAGLAERFDLHGLVVRPHDPTPRAWQFFETDGTRNEIFRTSYEGMAAMNPQPEDLPAFYERTWPGSTCTARRRMSPAGCRSCASAAETVHPVGAVGPVLRPGAPGCFPRVLLGWWIRSPPTWARPSPDRSY